MSILKKLSMASVGAALAAMGMLSAVEAQATTISGSGYTATDEIPYQFDDHDIVLSGTSVLTGSANDNASVTRNLGFSFQFYDDTYTQVSFSSNGLITFGGGNSSASNVDFTVTAPTPNIPSIAALWDDWRPASGAVYYQTLGSPGNQRFVMQWEGYTGTGNTNPMQFQAVLFEGSNDILFNYDDLTTRRATSPLNGQNYGGEATVGIRDDDGRNLQWSYNPGSSNSLLYDLQSIRFSKTQAVPFEFSPGLSILALGALFAAERLKSKLQHQKFSQSEFSSN